MHLKTILLIVLLLLPNFCKKYNPLPHLVRVYHTVWLREFSHGAFVLLLIRSGIWLTIFLFSATLAASITSIESPGWSMYTKLSHAMVI